MKKEEEKQVVSVEEGTLSSKQKFTKSESGDYVFNLNLKKKVLVKEFKNKFYVDIREFYQKDGKDLPTKKGVSMNEEVWNSLKSHISDIDAAVAKLK